MISREVLQLIRSTFILDWQGIHGLPHWSRVRVNGLQIARNNTADQKVVELFAFLHDVKREVDFNDPEHDPRAAAFIHSLPDTLLNIRPVQKERLEYACYYHSRGLTEADITIQTCWDADRLDLGRGGVRPDTKKLCTDIAKDPKFFEQAYQRATYWNRKQSPANKESIVQVWKPG